MAGLGPFGPDRLVAVAVSGGADSMALALLAAGWGRARALIVDHGLRAGSRDEAALTLGRLQARGIPARVLALRGLDGGPGLQARARAARFAALSAACEAEGLVDLLLGHHARDQAETVAIRRDAGSGPDGLAGMAALRVAGPVRLLRPLLGVAPGRLRATLDAAGMPWIEDPSNADPRFMRSRLRTMANPVTSHPADAGIRRSMEEGGCWPRLVTVAPGGYATLPAGPVAPRALASAVWTVSGRPYPPSPHAVRQAMGAATLHGTRILFARGRRFVVREEAATAPPAAARPGTVWDGRFRVEFAGLAGMEIGMLGDDAARLRTLSELPSAVLRTLPALRRNGVLWAVPHLGHPSPAEHPSPGIVFRPTHPVAGSPFVPSADASGVHLPATHPMFQRDGVSRPEPDGGFGWPGSPGD